MKNNKMKEFKIKVSNSSHMNWPAGHNFDVFDKNGKLILSGTHEYHTERTEWIDTFDENGNFDGSYQESGDFSSGHTNYNILDTSTLTVNHKRVAYFPHAALKKCLKYFKTDTIRLNW